MGERWRQGETGATLNASSMLGTWWCGSWQGRPWDWRWGLQFGVRWEWVLVDGDAGSWMRG